MDSLLAEMRELERGGGGGPRTGPVQSPPVAQLAAELDDSCWADQYIEAGKHFNVSLFFNILNKPVYRYFKVYKHFILLLNYFI